MPYVWKWKAVDKDGKPVEASPGLATFESRGPGTLLEMKNAAKILLDSKRQEAWYAGLGDPGYKIVEDSFQAIKDDSVSLPGEWKPPQAKPMQLPTESAPGQPIGAATDDDA